MTNIVTNSEILTTFVKHPRLQFPSQATRLVEVRMNAGAQGLVWCFTFVILEAVQAVFFGGVFQRMDAFLIGSMVFGLTTAGALSWTWFRDQVQISLAFENREALIGMNVSAAGGWIAYLLAIQLVEPAVAFTMFSGMVPITAIVAARFGVPEASASRNRFEMLGYIVLTFGLVALVAITLAGFSGFVRGGALVAMAGISLAAVSGVLITWMLFYCNRLDRAGVAPVAQFGLRFLFYLVLSLGGVALGLDAKGEVPVGDLAFAVLVGLLVMAFPIYAVQKAVTLVSPLTIGAGSKLTNSVRVDETPQHRRRVHFGWIVLVSHKDRSGGPASTNRSAAAWIWLPLVELTSSTPTYIWRCLNTPHRPAAPIITVPVTVGPPGTVPNKRSAHTAAKAR
jgi:drug/metabolite transporter (DMT)-like permease